ncbi:SDR family NAD(P)-dependent oxidoreductase [Streptomyces sp. NPDC001933]|uniref:SDR family NAD(P)-dependent oxidoreductase n=1 Tax=Streptomyces sp. NPDC001933 TaxID=3364626 RepID=UPI00369B3F3A
MTGTSSGFGNLSVRCFAEADWNVVATVRKGADLDVPAGLDSVKTLLLNGDHEDADLAFGDLALSQFGRLDALINNAGYRQGGPLDATTMDQVHHKFHTNVFGLIALNKTVIPIFRKQRPGVIANVSSISADAGFPYASAYEASKVAVTLQVIDYRNERFEGLVHDADAVLDLVGGETLHRSWAAVRPSGIVVSIVQPPDQEKAAARGARGLFFIVEPDRHGHIAISELIDTGKLKPVVDPSRTGHRDASGLRGARDGAPAWQDRSACRSRGEEAG